VSGDVRDITKGNERVVNSCRSVSDKRRKPLEKPKEIQRNTKIKTQPNTAVGIIADVSGGCSWFPALKLQ